MTTQNYQFNPVSPNTNKPTKVSLTLEQTAGHGDHWSILTDDINADVPQWLGRSIDDAVMPTGLCQDLDKEMMSNLLLSCDEMCHVNQVLAMDNGKPVSFINAYPCVNSPYGLNCTIERIIANDDTQDAVLRLVSEDGSLIYAYDQLYTVNHDLYQKDTPYYVNLSAWAYSVTPSNQDEIIKVEDQEAIRYHRAFNDIVAANGGEAPDNIHEQIALWQPETDEPLAPVEINLGNMCAYLFGETLGQEDEAWCQGQVLGKQTTTFYDKPICVLDVAVLREPDAAPMVIRMATAMTQAMSNINANDYIQANIWLQAAIYSENQDK